MIEPHEKEETFSLSSGGSHIFKLDTSQEVRVVSRLTVVSGAALYVKVMEKGPTISKTKHDDKNFKGPWPFVSDLASQIVLAKGAGIEVECYEDGGTAQDVTLHYVHNRILL